MCGTTGPVGALAARVRSSDRVGGRSGCRNHQDSRCRPGPGQRTGHIPRAVAGHCLDGEPPCTGLGWCRHCHVLPVCRAGASRSCWNPRIWVDGMVDSQARSPSEAPQRLTRRVIGRSSSVDDPAVAAGGEQAASGLGCWCRATGSYGSESRNPGA